MGNYQNEIIDHDLFCNQCYSHYLFEIFSKKNINIRKYCFCGESTFLINERIKYLLTNINIYCSAYKIMPNNNTNGYDGISNAHQKNTKYCPKCNLFLNDESAISHEHKNLVNSKEYINYCFFHRDSILIGFCKNCVKPICKKCINLPIHKNHNFKYTKDLMNDNHNFIENYETQLSKAFLDLDKLIKLKYGNKETIKVTNIQKSNIKNSCFYNIKDQQIILTLELLKTFLDLYNYHKKEDSLNYQIISNLLKHSDIKVFRNEKEESNISYNPDKRFIGISSDSQNNNSKCKGDENNINIIIDLKIKLNDIEIRENRLNIEFDRILNNNIIKMIKLKNGNLALCEINKILFLEKNFKVGEKYIIEKNNIIDFIELDNNKLVILLDNLINIYDIDKENFMLEKTINLEKGNHSLKNINKDSFAFLRETSQLDESYLKYFKYPLYEEDEIKFPKGSIKGNFIQVNNLIIICFELLELYKIIIYNLDNKNFDYCHINVKTKHTINRVNIFKINSKKILISERNHCFIFNIKVKQVETFINKFQNINFFGKIGGHLIVLKNRKILEVCLKKAKLYNEFILPEKKSLSGFADCLVSIIEVGNNQFCLLYGYYCIIFNYH